MKRGGSIASAQGFTIMETLIVLAVTSVLFLSAAMLINGKQNKTNFQLGIRSLQQQFQQLINETATGYYPNDGTSFTCDASGGGTNVTIGPGSTQLGENTGCIFIGRTLVLDTTKNDYLTVYSLAGAQKRGGVDVKTPTEARTTVIPSTKNPIKLPNGLSFVKAKINSSAAPWTTSGSFPFALISSLADFNESGVTTATQQLNTYSYASWSSSTSVNNESNLISQLDAQAGASGAYPSAPGVLLCFQSGGTNQSGLITITEGLEVTLDIKSGTGC